MSKHGILWFISFLAILVFSIPNLSFSTAEQRLALLIGNSRYTHAGSLPNPVNNVSAMEKALRGLGFVVMKYEDCSQKTMKNAIDEFGRNLKGKDVGLFFYSGHGIQVGGQNYLLPVDAKLDSANNAEFDCVRADRVLATMEAAGSKTNIVILDACRDNPFERGWHGSPKEGGLAFMKAPSGSLIAYSTAPGKIALDGSGRNSPYVAALLRHIDTPNIPVLQMFQKVRSTVLDGSDYKQIPWESASLTEDFYFFRKWEDDGFSAEQARLERARWELEKLRAEIQRKHRESKNHNVDPANLPQEKNPMEKGFLLDLWVETPEFAGLPAQGKRNILGYYFDAEMADDEYYKLPKERQIAIRNNFIDLHVLSDSPPSSESNVIKRDGAYVAYADGIVKDMKSGLEWKVGPDRDTSWDEAKSWVRSLNVAGAFDDGWRIPTADELKGLYGKGTDSRDLTPLLKGSGWWIWSSGSEGSPVPCGFGFFGGDKTWHPGDAFGKSSSGPIGFRAFAVRSRGNRLRTSIAPTPTNCSASSSSDIVRRDGVYVAYANGIVKDTKNGLEWKVGPDKNMNWEEAKSWVASLDLDGGGWRIPVIDELKTLYKKGVGSRNRTPLLKTTGWWVWSYEAGDSSKAMAFRFDDGPRPWNGGSYSEGARAIAVRSRIDG